MAINMTHEDINRISEKFRNNYPNILTLFQTRELIQQIELLEGNSNECIVSKMLNRNEISYWYALKPETLNLIEDFINKAIKNKENISGENSNQTHYFQENVLLNVSLKRHIQITNFPENGKFYIKKLCGNIFSGFMWLGDTKKLSKFLKGVCGFL